MMVQQHRLHKTDKEYSTVMYINICFGRANNTVWQKPQHDQAIEQTIKQRLPQNKDQVKLYIILDFFFELLHVIIYTHGVSDLLLIPLYFETSTLIPYKESFEKKNRFKVMHWKAGKRFAYSTTIGFPQCTNFELLLSP